MQVVTPSLKKTNFLMFDRQFDAVVLKLPKMGSEWSLDELQNSMRLDLIADSPSFVILGCGSTLQGL